MYGTCKLLVKLRRSRSCEEVQMESQGVLIGAPDCGATGVGADAEILAVRADRDGGRLDGRRGYLLAAANLRHRDRTVWRDHRVGYCRGRHVYAGARVPGARRTQTRSRRRRLSPTPRPGSATISGFCRPSAILSAPASATPFHWVLIKSTLGAFFPIFGNGDTLAAVVVSSIGIWIFHFTVLRGVQQAAASTRSSRSPRSCRSCCSS